MTLRQKKLTIIILKNLAKAGIAVVFAFIAISFLNKQIAKINDTILAKKRVTALIEKKNQIISNINENLQQIGDNDKKIEDSFPSSNEVLGVAGRFESLAAQNSLKQTLRFSDPAPFSTNKTNLKLSTLNYNSTINGNIYTFLPYLKGLENLPYFLTVQAITISAPAERGWEGNSTFSINGSLYIKEE